MLYAIARTIAAPLGIKEDIGPFFFVSKQYNYNPYFFLA
jgi:hypothetical protein